MIFNAVKLMSTVTMILGIANKFHYIQYPHIGCCLNCSAIFHLMLRAHIEEMNGVYLVYSGVTCPVCHQVVAAVQEWVILEKEPVKMSDELEYNMMVQEKLFPKNAPFLDF